MTEDDTYWKLRKWARGQLYEEYNREWNLPERANVVAYKEYWDKILFKAGWTRNEWNEDFKRTRDIH